MKTTLSKIKLFCGAAPLLLSIATDAIAAPKVTLAWSIGGLQQPESALYLPAEDAYLISNINGAPMELNGKGYLSKVSAEGKLLQQKWVQGLDAPKGMGYFNGTVYVADMQQLVQFDSATGEVLARYKAPQSKMLNDVTVDESGSVFVSDLVGGGIYRLRDGELSLWLSPEQLPHPNGVQIQDNQLSIASWGEGMQADFSTTKLGSVYQLSPGAHAKAQPGQLHLVQAELGNLDGLEHYADSWLTNDWFSGQIFAVKDSKAELVLEAGPGASDITVAGDKLLVPRMFDGLFEVYQLD